MYRIRAIQETLHEGAPTRWDHSREFSNY